MAKRRNSHIIINARFLCQRPAGVQRFAIEIAKRMKARYSNVKFVCPPQIHPHNEVLAKQLQVEKIGWTKGYFWEQVELPLFLVFKGPFLLINFCTTAPLLVRKQIVTIHDAIFRLYPQWFSRSLAVIYNFLVPIISRRSLKVITVSESAKKDLLSFINVPEEKIVVVNNAVSELFSDNKMQHQPNPYGKYILTVSSFDPRKNYKRVIEAFLHSNLPDYKLVIVGKSHITFSKERALDAYQSDSRIVFTGYVSDEELIALYFNAEFFLYMSLYEGFGIPPLEAMACDCPVLTSEVSSIPEVCGDAVLYADPYSIEDISEKIKLLSTDSRLRSLLRERGRERMMKFDWEESTSKISSIINEYATLEERFGL